MLIFLLMMVPGTFLLGLNDVLVRRVLRRGTTSEQLLLGYEFVAVGILSIIPLMIQGLPDIKPGFWSAIIIGTVLNVFAQWSWYTAFKKEEASLISPLRLITPPLVLITGYLILREEPTLGGIVGVLITVVGLLLLLQSEAVWSGKRLVDVIKRPGVLLGIWGAVSFAISLPLDKKAVVNSSALLTVVLAFLGVGLANVIIGKLLNLRDQGARRIDFKNNLGILLTLPFIHALAAFFTFSALNYALVAYAGSIKRLWSFWTVLLSGKLLGEQNIGKKLLATAIMLAGIAVTVLLG